MFFGVHLWTGLTLNIPIALFATLTLFALATQLLQNRYEALLVAATYALNPSTVLISKEARQYDLLILWLVLTIWLTHTITKNKTTKRRSILWLTLVLAAGNLTHYLFLLTVPMACFTY